MDISKVKINDRIISIPPFISTTWLQVSSVLAEGSTLVITLKDQKTISIPELSDVLMSKVFESHTQYLEKLNQNVPIPQPQLPSFLHGMKETLPPFGTDSSFQIAFNTVDGLNLFQHHPEQSQMMDIPEDLLQKISSIIKLIVPIADIEQALGEPHSGCNCMHCQVVRSISPNPQETNQSDLEEEVKVEELQFSQWNIKQTGERLFEVSDKLHPLDLYHVYLGDPVGCTCGKSGCEHILSVLRS